MRSIAEFGVFVLRKRMPCADEKAGLIRSGPLCVNRRTRRRAPDIYSTRWSIARLAEPYRDLMEWQIVIELAGGIAEAIRRGERRRREVMWFAAINCNIAVDLEQATAVLADLRELTGRRYGTQRFTERPRALLLTHWPAVEARASALIENRHIEGERVEQIIAL